MLQDFPKAPVRGFESLGDPLEDYLTRVSRAKEKGLKDLGTNLQKGLIKANERERIQLCLPKSVQ